MLGELLNLFRIESIATDVTPNPFDPGATLAAAIWPLVHCLEPPWPSEMAAVDRLALGGG